jgi:hypothetical protein
MPLGVFMNREVNAISACHNALPTPPKEKCRASILINLTCFDRENVPRLLTNILSNGILTVLTLKFLVKLERRGQDVMGRESLGNGFIYSA